MLGAEITIHGAMFGKLVSRGARIGLKRNLVGGSAYNARGDMTVADVASSAVLQTRDGELRVAREKNCLLSGGRIHIDAVPNCDIVAEGDHHPGRRLHHYCTLRDSGPRRAAQAERDAAVCAGIRIGWI